jgi:hypothetical protein
MALVELDEGVRMLLRVAEYPLTALAIDLPGEVHFTPLTAEVSLPVFVPRPS